MQFSEADQAKLSFFQLHCVDHVRSVLARNGISYSGFEVEGESDPWVKAEFSFQGKPHLVQITSDMVVMWAGENAEDLYEPYMSSEFKTGRALIEGFANRLDRYLGGGPWAGPDEPGFLDFLWSGIKRVLRFGRADH
jgi:hypothetical protein